MKTTYTPGPWFIDQYGHVYGMVPTADPTMKTSVCLVDGRYSAANARDKILMAAAPELLAALENAANVLAGIATGDLKTIGKDSPALAQARAAIAKAEGGA